MPDAPPITAARRASIFEGYHGLAGEFDELLQEDRDIRPHWMEFAKSLEKLGPDELKSRWEEARRTIKEHGVTYNVYSDSQGMDRPWELDLMPMIISAGEWAQIEAGLSQRATLLNKILADVYGPQKLVQSGALPSALIHGNPAYLRPCHGIPVPRGIHLFLHAVDLARSPDGQWWVLADRTQSPSGAGYALENRIVLSRILPDEFRDCRVERLASFFQIERDTLRSLAPSNRENPNVVLLTPGPYNETYFEQAYMARYLGFTLVEGADLTVRNRRVFVKTLEGLQQVDVILRRVDDSFCDPLELRADSYLGVAGLVDAVRAGNVTVANSLGSGLVETPGLLAFLPSLCRRVLGEDLKLPNVATWWCGQPIEFDVVLDNLEEIVVKRTFPSRKSEAVFADRLGERRKLALVQEMQAASHQFVGQEQVRLSTAPVWTPKGMEPRQVVLRAYVVATGDGYKVMPGGLTRVSKSVDDPVVSMQSGGGSKDTWVLSEGEVKMVTLLKPPSQAIHVERAAAEVPSRIADNLYWLGRYTERLESMLRILRCAIRHLSDEAGEQHTPERLAIVRMMVNLQMIHADVDHRSTFEEVEKEILSIVFKSHRADGLREMVNRIRHIATLARDRFSADTWRLIVQLQEDVRSRPRRLPVADALVLINTLILDLAAFNGLISENMTRGHGWRFLELGRRLERAWQMAATVQAALKADPRGSVILEPLLEVGDSVMTYRRRYFAHAQLPTVLHLLLLDETNPRSVEFQIRALKDHALNLPSDWTGPGPSREQRMIAGISALLHSADILSSASSDEVAGGGRVAGLLGRLKDEIQEVSNRLTHQYFSHTASRVS